MPQKRLTAGGKTRWVGRYRDAAGKQHSRTFDKKTDATEWENDHKQAVKRGDWSRAGDEHTTVRDLVAEWVCEASRESTRTNRRQLADNLGDLGGLPMRAARPQDFRAWATQLRDGRPWADGRALSARTVRNRLYQMRGIFERAVMEGRLPKDPTVSLQRFPLTVEDPKTQAEHIPARGDIDRVLECAPSAWFHTAVRLASEAGLRAGEVAGLRVKDVDPDTSMVFVRVQPGGAPLKTRSSKRNIPIPASLAAELAQWCVGKAADEPVLVDGQNRALTSEIIGKTMGDARRRAGGIDAVTFHSFRHYYASAMLANLVPLPTVSMLLGHSSPAMTATVYAHHLPDQLDVARRVVEKISAPTGGAGEGA